MCFQLMWIESVLSHSSLACNLLWPCSLIEISDTELSGIHWSRKVSYWRDTTWRARGRHYLFKINASNSWELSENENSWKFHGKFSGKCQQENLDKPFCSSLWTTSESSNSFMGRGIFLLQLMVLRIPGRSVVLATWNMWRQLRVSMYIHGTLYFAAV